MWTQIIAQKAFSSSSEKLTIGIHHLSSKEETSIFNDSYAAFLRIRDHFYTYYIKNCVFSLNKNISLMYYLFQSNRKLRSSKIYVRKHLSMISKYVNWISVHFTSIYSINSNLRIKITFLQAILFHVFADIYKYRLHLIMFVCTQH